MIVEYLKSNTWKLIFLILLLSTKSILNLCYFPVPAWQPLAKVGIFFLAILLSLLIIKTWRFKLYTLALIIGICYLQGFLRLWKIPASHYVITLEATHHESIQRIVHHPELISSRINSETDISVRVGKMDKEDSLAIHAIFRDSEVLGIEKDNLGTLFILDSFVGNGYGVFYSNEKNVEILNQKSRYTVNGYEVTGLVHIHGNWYYLSFT